MLFVVFGAAPTFAAETLFRDNFDAPNLADLSGRKIGSVAWQFDGKMQSRADGAATPSAANGATIFHSLPAVNGVYRAEVEIILRGSNSVALSLLDPQPAGRFYQSNEVMLGASVHANGDSSFEFKCRELGVVSSGLIPAAAKIQPDDFNHLAIVCDLLTRRVSAAINGAEIASAELPANWSANIHHAGVRFNGPDVQTGVTAMKNYEAGIRAEHSSGFVPLDVSAFYFDPDQSTTLQWRPAISGDGAINWRAVDYAGAPAGAGAASIDADGIVSVEAKFPQGYYEITLLASGAEVGETFGIIALPSAKIRDPFFGMDVGITWLDTNVERRPAMIKALARVGVTQARERLGVGRVNPAAEQYTWDNPPNYPDSVRQLYAQNGIRVLEMLGGVDYMDLIPVSPWFIGNYVALERATAELTKKWSANWSGLEIWNEPDLSTLPADQYAPLVKAASYALARLGSDVPIVGGVTGNVPPTAYFAALTQSQMLADCDAYSFHDYQRAPETVRLTRQIREWLAQNGKPEMAIWRTESGWAWSMGPSRPPLAEDVMSAMEIAMKGIDSKACGITAHFPFVYPFYEEGGIKSFSMLGREATPLRSMAAYAFAINQFAGAEYVGDLAPFADNVKLTRVFRRPDNTLSAAIYSGAPAPDAKLKLPTGAVAAFGADGRRLPVSDGAVSFADGMIFCELDASAKIIADTEAIVLWRQGEAARNEMALIDAKKGFKPERHASPLIWRFLGADQKLQSSSQRYLLKDSDAKKVALKFRLYNLSENALTVTPELQLPNGEKLPLAPITVSASGTSDCEWNADLTESLDVAETRFILAAVADAPANIPAPTPLAVPLIMTGELETHLSRWEKKRRLPINEIARWEDNIAGHGKMTSQPFGEFGWRMDCSFDKPGDAWVYPRFELKEPLGDDDCGFIVRARVLKKASNSGLMTWGATERVNYWALYLFPDDGEWHTVFVPFSEFIPAPGHPDMQNARLNPERWKYVGIGFGSRSADQTNALEVSDWWIVSR
jgi:hypothetical protein